MGFWNSVIHRKHQTQETIMKHTHTHTHTLTLILCLWNSLMHREMQVLEAQAGSGCAEGGVGEVQSGLAASTALIEKILSEEPRWQGMPALLLSSNTSEYKCTQVWLPHFFFTLLVRQFYFPLSVQQPKWFKSVCLCCVGVALKWYLWNTVETSLMRGVFTPLSLLLTHSPTLCLGLCHFISLTLYFSVTVVAQTTATSCPTIKRNCARNHRGSVAKDTPARTTTTAKTAAVAHTSTNTGVE